MNRILDTIDSPAQLKRLTPAQLERLAKEIRQEIIEAVSLRGGHLAPNLGAVELTLALHIAFNAPHDLLVWDIGHQAYPHKLVTGRRDTFRSLKTLGGISGYLRRVESEYDAFGASHASTSISAALGMAVARDLKGENFNVVAIIGDGALTGGMALEAINHAGSLHKRLIIVLNDNDKSISDNVGALHSYLSRMRENTNVRRFKDVASDTLDHAPGGSLAKQVAKRAARSAKEFVLPSKSGVIFEELGYTFLGPFDGHNVQQMIEAFRNAQRLEGPIIVQVVTQKGRGCDFAEADPTKYHGPGAYDLETGELKKKPGEPPKYQSVFGETLVELAKRDERIVGITAAMSEGTSLNMLQKAIPERFFDVGIAEQHAVTFAAGLACGGMKPVAAIYSTFLQRAYDQVIHDVCVQNLHVVFPMDRAGLVGEDGHTQQGVFDIAMLRTLPNMKLMAPKDENELRHMLYTALNLDGPVALRYPRGSGFGVEMDAELRMLPVGK
ncbi:MAG TPA: 1-deoxy-D-xylulose-5-phosphate synthase, partial [Ktedonobacterales bacterium]|nr:1-deoxy-D-xylulose-5-phosphate synthase [Ktedonobacterales bacterium]